MSKPCKDRAHAPVTWVLAAQPWGAHILSARREHNARVTDIFYLSPISNGACAPVRGGVPVLFPQFNELGGLPKHGLARTARWVESPRRAADSADLAQRSFRLQIGPDQHADWPHSAALHLVLRALAGSLELTLDVLNTGASAFSWTGGLHPYFAVDNVCQSVLTGLEGTQFTTRAAARAADDNEAPIRWSGAMLERLYHSARSITLCTPTHRLHLSMSGFNEWMVWNPGRELAEGIADLPNGDWQRFVCIEPVCVSQPVQLAPRERFTGSLRITVEGLA